MAYSSIKNTLGLVLIIKVLVSLYDKALTIWSHNYLSVWISRYPYFQVNRFHCMITSTHRLLVIHEVVRIVDCSRFLGNRSEGLHAGLSWHMLLFLDKVNVPSLLLYCLLVLLVGFFLLPAIVVTDSGRFLPSLVPSFVITTSVFPCI